MPPCPPRILLIPPPNMQGGRLHPYVPQGLLSLQAVARRLGGGVDVLLWSGESNWSPAPVSSEELGIAVADLVDTDRYGVVGLSTMCSSFHHSLNIVASIKRRSPRTRIWLGGPQASVAPGRVLEAFPEIEAVFVGEGEATFREVLQRRHTSPDLSLHDVPGVRVRDSPFVPRPPISDLDSLPFIDQADGFMPAVIAAEAGEDPDAVPVEAERGCPGRCTFCSTRLFWGSRVRRKSDPRLIAEMLRLARATGKTSVSLIGDNFASPHGRLMGFCAAMRGGAPDLRWYCSLKLDRLGVGDLNRLWDGGCRGFFVGLESASQRTLNKVGKDVDLERELEVVHAAIDRGFSIDTSFIIGFPWENEDDMSETYTLHADLLKRGVARSIVTVLSPLPGTDLQREYADHVLPHAGLSKAALDDLAYGPGTTEMMRRCPELFTQLGYFVTGARQARVAAVAHAAGMLSGYHLSKRKTRATAV